MKKALGDKIRRLGISIVIALAVFGGVAGGLAASTGHSDAAIKWGEHGDPSHPTPPPHPTQAHNTIN